MAAWIRNHNLTADGDTPAINWPGGRLGVLIQGDFSGGTAELQVSFDEGATFSAVGISFSGEGYATEDIPPTALVKVNLSGGTTPDVNVTIMPIDSGQL